MAAWWPKHGDREMVVVSRRERERLGRSEKDSTEESRERNERERLPEFCRRRGKGRAEPSEGKENEGRKGSKLGHLAKPHEHFKYLFNILISPPNFLEM